MDTSSSQAPVSGGGGVAVQPAIAVSTQAPPTARSAMWAELVKYVLKRLPFVLVTFALSTFVHLYLVYEKNDGYATASGWSAWLNVNANPGSSAFLIWTSISALGWSFLFTVFTKGPIQALTSILMQPVFMVKQFLASTRMEYGAWALGGGVALLAAVVLGVNSPAGFSLAMVWAFMGFSQLGQMTAQLIFDGFTAVLTGHNARLRPPVNLIQIVLTASSPGFAIAGILAGSPTLQALAGLSLIGGGVALLVTGRPKSELARAAGQVSTLFIVACGAGMAFALAEMLWPRSAWAHDFGKHENTSFWSALKNGASTVAEAVKKSVEVAVGATAGALAPPITPPGVVGGGSDGDTGGPGGDGTQTKPKPGRFRLPWDSLTPAQKAQWDAEGQRVTWYDPLGRPYHPTGEQLYQAAGMAKPAQAAPTEQVAGMAGPVDGSIAEPDWNNPNNQYVPSGPNTLGADDPFGPSDGSGGYTGPNDAGWTGDPPVSADPATLLQDPRVAAGGGVGAPPKPAGPDINDLLGRFDDANQRAGYAGVENPDGSYDDTKSIELQRQLQDLIDRYHASGNDPKAFDVDALKNIEKQLGIISDQNADQFKKDTEGYVDEKGDYHAGSVDRSRDEYEKKQKEHDDWKADQDDLFKRYNNILQRVASGDLHSGEGLDSLDEWRDHVVQYDKDGHIYIDEARLKDMEQQLGVQHTEERAREQRIHDLYEKDAAAKVQASNTADKNLAAARFARDAAVVIDGILITGGAGAIGGTPLAVAAGAVYGGVTEGGVTLSEEGRLDQAAFDKAAEAAKHGVKMGAIMGVAGAGGGKLVGAVIGNKFVAGAVVGGGLGAVSEGVDAWMAGKSRAEIEAAVKHGAASGAVLGAVGAGVGGYIEGQVEAGGGGWKGLKGVQIGGSSGPAGAPNLGVKIPAGMPEAAPAGGAPASPGTADVPGPARTASSGTGPVEDPNVISIKHIEQAGGMDVPSEGSSHPRGQSSSGVAEDPNVIPIKDIERAGGMDGSSGEKAPAGRAGGGSSGSHGSGSDSGVGFIDDTSQPGSRPAEGGKLQGRVDHPDPTSIKDLETGGSEPGRAGEQPEQRAGGAKAEGRAGEPGDTVDNPHPPRGAAQGEKAGAAQQKNPWQQIIDARPPEKSPGGPGSLSAEVPPPTPKVGIDPEQFQAPPKGDLVSGQQLDKLASRYTFEQLQQQEAAAIGRGDQKSAEMIRNAIETKRVTDPEGYARSAYSNAAKETPDWMKDTPSDSRPHPPAQPEGLTPDQQQRIKGMAENATPDQLKQELEIARNRGDNAEADLIQRAIRQQKLDAPTQDPAASGESQKLAGNMAKNMTPEQLQQELQNARAAGDRDTARIVEQAMQQQKAAQGPQAAGERASQPSEERPSRPSGEASLSSQDQKMVDFMRNRPMEDLQIQYQQAQQHGDTDTARLLGEAIRQNGGKVPAPGEAPAPSSGPSLPSQSQAAAEPAPAEPAPAKPQHGPPTPNKEDPTSRLSNWEDLQQAAKDTSWNEIAQKKAQATDDRTKNYWDQVSATKAATEGPRVPTEAERAARDAKLQAALDKLPRIDPRTGQPYQQAPPPPEGGLGGDYSDTGLPDAHSSRPPEPSGQHPQPETAEPSLTKDEKRDVRKILENIEPNKNPGMKDRVQADVDERPAGVPMKPPNVDIPRAEVDPSKLTEQQKQFVDQKLEQLKNAQPARPIAHDDITPPDGTPTLPRDTKPPSESQPGVSSDHGQSSLTPEEQRVDAMRQRDRLQSMQLATDQGSPEYNELQRQIDAQSAIIQGGTQELKPLAGGSSAEDAASTEAGARNQRLQATKVGLDGNETPLQGVNNADPFLENQGGRPGEAVLERGPDGIADIHFGKGTTDQQKINLVSKYWDQLSPKAQEGLQRFKR